MTSKVKKIITGLQFKHPDGNTKKDETKQHKGGTSQQKEQRKPSPQWAYEF